MFRKIFKLLSAKSSRHRKGYIKFSETLKKIKLRIHSILKEWMFVVNFLITQMCRKIAKKRKNYIELAKSKKTFSSKVLRAAASPGKFLSLLCSKYYCYI